MELGEDYAALAVELAKRQPSTEIDKLKEKINLLEYQVQTLLKENKELNERLKLSYLKDENVAGFITPGILETETRNVSDKYLTEGLWNRNIPWEEKHNLYKIQEVEDLKNEQDECGKWSQIERI